MAYVYVHRRLDTGQVFYIGKGTGDRAWISQDRNRDWNKIVDETTWSVEIIKDNLTDSEAFILEQQLIEQHDFTTLTNQLPNAIGGYKAIRDEVRKQETLNRIEQSGKKVIFKCSHSVTSENTYTFPNGKQTCRTCHRDRVREWRHKKKRDKT